MSDHPALDPGDPAMEAASRDRWLKLKPGDRFIDVGACRGSWSLPAMAMGASVVAFEPTPEVALLEGSARRYGLSQNLIVRREWIGDGVHPENSFTLDALLLGTTPPDFIKIDVEGWEMEVLRGASTLLHRYRPRLMIEVHTNAVPGRKVQVSDVKEFLDGLCLGYVYEESPSPADGWYVHLYCEVPK